MASNKEDDYQLKCDIIDKIRDYPLIYDKSHPKHYNRDARVDVFNEIAEQLNTDGKQF